MRAGIPLALACLATCYVWLLLDRGWIPHDDGQLGQTAERILLGEVPHRDFVDPYTGGLGYLHATAFRIVGVKSIALRWVLVPFYFAFVLCVYHLVARVATTGAASLVTLLCAALTLPVYPGSVPSWFNLFFATYGTAALMKHIETDRRRWLFLAGICGGVSMLFKVTGLYFVGAGCLFLLYREQLSDRPDAPRSRAFSVLVTVAMVAFGALAGAFAQGPGTATRCVHFALPLLAVAASVVVNEWAFGRGQFGERAKDLWRLLLPFTAGVACALLPLVIYFSGAQAVGELLHGVFVLPRRRLAEVQLQFPPACWLAMGLPPAALLLWGVRRRSPLPRSVTVVSTLIVGLLLAASFTGRGYAGLLQSMRQSIPFIVLVGLLTVSHLGSRQVSDRRHRQALWLLCSVAFFVSLVQFPYSGAFYFFYAAPLGVIAAAYASALQPHGARQPLVAWGVLLLLFAALHLHHPGPAVDGGLRELDIAVERSDMPRCRLRMRAEQAQLYGPLISLIAEQTAPGDFIYAGPDAPEVYFLSGRRNPTRDMYQVFSNSDEQLFELLAERPLRVVVLKCHTEFSQTATPGLHDFLSRKYPQRREFRLITEPQGPPRFVVYWKPGGGEEDGAKQTYNAAAADAPSLIPVSAAL